MTTPQGQEHLRARGRWLPLLVLVAVMFGIGGRYLWGIHVSFDLNAADEGMYMHRALLWLLHGQPIGQEWGPVYHAWLAWLAQRTNPVIAFYLSLYMTAWVPPVLLALLVYRHTRQMGWSVLAGTAFLVSWGNYGDWRVNHFLAAGVLAVLLLVPPRLSRRGQVVWLGVQMWAAWGLAYVRPEMFLTAVLFMVWEGWTLWQTRRVLAGQWVWRAGAALLVAFLGVAWATNPWRNPSGRMLVAFGQHFAVRWEARTGAALDPYHRWYEVLEDQFGPVHSVAEAAVARPDLFVWFVFRNVRGWFLVAAQRLAPLPWKAHWPVMVALLAAVALAVGVLFWRRVWPQGDADEHRDQARWLLMLLAWAAPAVLSSWMFYPRPHYQAVPLVLGWAVLGYLLARVWPLAFKGDWGGVAVLLLVMLTVFPQPYQQGDQPRLQAVLWLRHVAAAHPRPLVWTTDAGYMGYFYTVDVLDVVDVADGDALPEAQPARLPDLWHPWPFSEAVLNQRAWLTMLAAAPEAHGFVSVTLPDGTPWLMRQDWLAKP